VLCALKTDLLIDVILRLVPAVLIVLVIHVTWDAHVCCSTSTEMIEVIISYSSALEYTDQCS
jgi:hypothetical protein